MNFQADITPEQTRLALSLHAAFQQSNDVMFICDKAGVIREANPAFTRVFGYTRAEAVGQTPRLIRSRHSTPEFYQSMWKSLLDPAKGYWRGQLINRAKDGREIPVILAITAVRDGEGDVVGYVSSALDTSDQVALRGRVAQSEALAGLGEMAAVVAHEIRNPLGSIVMAAKHLAGPRLAKKDRESVLKVLREESQRLNETLTNFLAFARPRDLRLAPADLNAVVGDTCKMAFSNKNLAGKTRLQLELEPGLKPFPMDADQVRQVAWNIVINSLQALGGRGALRVKTGRGDGESYFMIEDDGPGIPAEKAADIFKPFFTTKRQGTGLGLAIAERIAKAHGGRIELGGGAGRGAAFTVHLPMVQE